MDWWQYILDLPLKFSHFFITLPSTIFMFFYGLFIMIS